MPYGPYDDDVEVRIPRHDKQEAGVSIEPSSLGLHGRQHTDLSPASINPPGVYDWYFFTLELQTSLSAGLPFVQAVSLVATDAPKHAIRRAGNIILQQLQHSSASKAIMQASAIPPLIRQMLVVSLRGGDTGPVLRMVVDHYGWLLDIRGQVLRVIAYPAMLTILGAAIMILRDVAMATLARQQDPQVAERLSAGEAAVQASLRYGLPILAGAVAGIVLAWLVYLPGIRTVFDRIVVTAPVVGKIIRQYSQAVFFRVMAVLMEAGMPVTDAWNMSARVMPNEHLGKAMEQGLRFLRDGEPLEEALRQTNVMDRESNSMAAIGEVAGTVPAALRRYSAYREMELRSRVKMITSLLGLPCLVIIALGYFHNSAWLAALVFVLVFIRRAI